MPTIWAMQTAFQFLLQAIGFSRTKVGGVYIRMVDATSGAVIYWDNKNGHCAVRPVFMTPEIAKSEQDRAIKFYGCPVHTQILSI